MRTADFHFDLPPELIAQHPAPQRDGSRLLVLHRDDGRLDHRRFTDLPDHLKPGDVLVLNDSRVIPARIRGFKPASGGEVEILLVTENRINDWWVLLRPGRRVRTGTRICFWSVSDAAPVTPQLTAVVREKNADGEYRLEFDGPGDVRHLLDGYGEVPLPPYIQRDGLPEPEDADRYQTIFARPPGSVAAPTAGLHFTTALLDHLRASGVGVHFVTLHVGPGTFAPVKAGRIQDHVMHEEAFEIPATTAAAVQAAKAQGRRIVAVGTTSVRVLETWAAQGGLVSPAPDGAAACPPAPLGGRTRIFIHPPHTFQVVDVLLTNFHLPESTLLMLVSAFAAPGATHGRDLVLAAYAEAVRQRYRFFSYGDAMLVL